MDRRRIIIYVLLDVIVWIMVAWLLVGDNTQTRMAFWYRAKRVSWFMAREWGLLGMYAERQYAQLAAVV